MDVLAPIILACVIVARRVHGHRIALPGRAADHRQGRAFLEHRAHPSTRSSGIGDALKEADSRRGPIIAFRKQERLEVLLNALLLTEHNAFPVLDDVENETEDSWGSSPGPCFSGCSESSWRPTTTTRTTRRRRRGRGRGTGADAKANAASKKPPTTPSEHADARVRSFIVVAQEHRRRRCVEGVCPGAVTRANDPSPRRRRRRRHPATARRG